MLVVDFAAMAGAITHLEQFGRSVQEVLEDVDQAMAVLHATWHGEASDAQAQFQQQWEDGARLMNEQLTKLKDVLAGAKKNYTDAASRNGEMWD
ncbi:WXG100 family type VII secretion target [Mycobacteroides abscessus subsp. abscessus]|nr:WXG100 family type VII secretion target [Mycobacteroides abscessus subsp. abscessus]